MNKLSCSKLMIMACLMLSSLLIFGQPALAKKKSRQLIITQVDIDYENDLMTILGDNFDKGKAPVVVLCGKDFNGSVAGPDMITVDLTEDGFSLDSILGLDCLLTVNTGKRKKQFDAYDLTLGAVGPAGDQGEKGDQGEQGIQGDKGGPGDQGPKGDSGANGATGEKGEKGDTGATGAKGDTGEKGDKGDTGASGGFDPASLYTKTASSHLSDAAACCNDLNDIVIDVRCNCGYNYLQRMKAFKGNTNYFPEGYCECEGSSSGGVSVEVLCMSVPGGATAPRCGYNLD